MSLTITVTFDDSVNGSTTDTFSLDDTDAGTLLSVLSVANTSVPPGLKRAAREQQLPLPPVRPLVYDELYHTIANNFWLGLQARVHNIQREAAQDAAMAQAQASVKVITAAAATKSVRKGQE